MDKPAIPIHMDEEKRRELARACAAIMRALAANCPNAIMAHAALTMCRDTLGEACGIGATIFLENPTEKLQ